MNRRSVYSIIVVAVSGQLVACLSAKAPATKDGGAVSDASSELADATADAAATVDSGGAATDGGTTPNDAAAAHGDGGGTIYVVSATTNSLISFPVGTSGNVAPSAVVTGSSTGIATPINIAIDSTGNVYVASRTGAGVPVFAPGATGNVAPIRTLTNPQMRSTSGVAIAADDSVYVSTCPDCGSASGGDIGVWHFPSGASTSDRSLGGATDQNTLMTNPGSIQLDSVGNLYVGNAFGGAVEAFPATATGDVAPTFSFTIAGANLQSIGYGAGTVFAAVPGGGIEEFAVAALASAGLSDGGLPDASATISFAYIGATYPGAMFVDARGATPTIYLADYSGDAVYIIPTTGSPGAWAAGTMTSIKGAATMLSGPIGIVVAF